MDVRRFLYPVRRFTPFFVYPFLSPIFRWVRRRAILRLDTEDSLYRSQHPGVVAPDATLRFNVSGACDIPSFLAGGKQTADDIGAAVAKAGGRMEAVRKALDFGCGCGRSLIETSRRWPTISWTGCDVDKRGVQWCVDHLPNVTAVVNNPLPPLPFPDNEFDLVWCASVFTHLDENRQNAWLAELRRVLAPGGLLVASVHGPNCWKRLNMPSWEVERIKKLGFLFARTDYDKGFHPDWYQSAFHTRDYIDKNWSRYLEQVAYIPEGLNGYQDLAVGRKSDS